MDKAVIIGTYEFLGFSLCGGLLEKGYQVDGIHLDIDEEDLFLEEKRMEIGRNANFTEWSLKDWQQQMRERESAVLIISVYDYFIKNQIQALLKDEQIWNEILSRFFKSENEQQILMLWPIQLLVQNNGSGALDQFFEKLTHHPSVISVFIPTLFGPWQPKQFIFQQTFLQQLGNKVEPVLNKNEWVFDAIYIEDSIKKIIDIFENKSMKSCFLRNTIHNSWLKCAKSLAIETIEVKETVKEDLFVDCKVPAEPVEPVVELFDGLKNQKDHLERILSFKNL
jgi:hypothetical protein